MLPPRTIWIDADDWEHANHRLVILESPDPTIANQYYLEFKGEPDAMGRYQWHDYPLDWTIFQNILQHATFPAVPVEPPNI